MTSPIHFSPFSDPERDWPGDFEHENGNYLRRCTSCDHTFIGYKRRLTCRKCEDEAKARWDKLTPEQQREEEAANRAAAIEIFKTLDKGEQT